MNRELRRERTRNKWISRARKIYNSWGTFDVPIRGIKHSYPNTIETYRDCESITDFLNDSIFAKKCLLDFIDYARWKFPGDSIEVYPDDERRRKVYEYALLPLGFKIMKNKYKTLIYKL